MDKEATQKRVLNGCLKNLPEQESTHVRVFFSSTFTDMTVDRNYLMRNSVQRIREHCLKIGLDFQIVDFRWGVRDEASIDHSTNDIVVRVVDHCKQMSRGPYFVLFLGDKYGSRTLPSHIEANEYKILYRTAMKLGCDTLLINQWFKKDDNAEPAVFYFLPITDVLPNYNNEDPQKAALKEKDQTEWTKVEAKLAQYFRKAADQAYEENRITKEQRLKYFYSVTEAEATEGIINSDSIRNRVLSYFRAFEDLNINDEKAGRFTDLKDGRIDQEAKDLRERLKIAKVQPVLLPDEMKKDTLYWTPVGVDPDNKDHKEYLTDLDKHFEEKIIKMIKLTCKKKSGNPADDMLFEEILQHLHFVQHRLKYFSGREEILEEIRDRMSVVHGIKEDIESEKKSIPSDTSPVNEITEHNNKLKDRFDSRELVPKKGDPYFADVKEKRNMYKEKGIIYANGDMDQDIDSDPEKNIKLELIKKCELKEYCRPVILYGDSGCGKTSIMAKVTELSKSWFPECRTIVRFLGTSVTSSSIRDVMCSIVFQLFKICNKVLPSTLDLGGDILYLTQFFEALIVNYSDPQPLVIILDSVDQLTSHDHAYLMNWIPLRIPQNVYFIVSMVPDIHDCLLNMRNRMVFDHQYIQVPALALDTSDIIISKVCQYAGRRVTKPQRRHLLEMFSKCGRPLYVKLLVDKATLWRSSTDVSEFKVGHNVQAAVDMFFDYLEKRNGTVVVEKAFGFLSAAKEGLSYAEIEDLMSLDDEVLQDTYLYHLPPDPDNIRIPSSVLSLLIMETKDYLVMQKSGGKKVLRWYHRQFTEVARKRYLKKPGHNIYQTLVDYFRGCWHDKEKPLELFKKKKGSYPTAKRGVPAQPIYYDSVKCNMRKLIELPTHLMKAKLFKDIRDEIACCFEWLYAKCKYVSVSSVIEDLKMALSEIDAVGDIDSPDIYNDIKIVERMLSLGIENIRKDTFHLALQILGQLGPDYRRSPPLKKLVDETLEWAQNSTVPLILPVEQCLPSPDGYMMCMLSARVDAYDNKRENYGHTMHLQERNNVLIVLENKKDNKDDYISAFDMNDNGSAAFSEKICKAGAVFLTCCVNDKFTILSHKGSEGISFSGASYSDQLLKTETFAPVNLPNTPDCITASDKFVVYSAITQINICSFGQNMTALSVMKTIQMEDRITYLIISPDNSYLVTFSEKSLTVFSLENLEKKYTIDSEKKSFGYDSVPYRSLVFILKNNRLIYRGIGYGDNKKLFVLDLESGKQLYSISHWEHYSPIVVSCHPSERFIAVGHGSTSVVNGDNDKQWYIHRTEDGTQVSGCTKEFSGKYGVACLRLFGTDNIFAVSAMMYTEMNDIKVFYGGTLDNPLEKVVPCKSLKGHSRQIVQLLLSKDENTLYSASKDCTIRVWNLGRVVTEFLDYSIKYDVQFDESKAVEDFRKETKSSSTTAIKISSDDKSVFLGMSDGQLRVHDLSNGSMVYEHNIESSITHLITARSGEEIIVIPLRDDILILDAKNYSIKQKLYVPFKVDCAAEANSILVVGCGGMEAKGRAFNITDGTLLKEFSLLYSLSQVAINSTGTKIVSTMFDFPLVCPLTSEDETDSTVQNMMEFNDTMMSGCCAVDISPDDEFAFSASTDGGIRVVKMSGKYVMRFDQKSSSVAALFSPDSKFIVSCGFKTIYVWSLSDGGLSYKLKRHDDFVINLKFDHTGKYLLTSSRDKRIILWDFHRGISLALFVAHCQPTLIDLSSGAKKVVFIPEDIADFAILKPNKVLTSVIDGKHHLQITPSLLGAQAMALSFSSQKMRQREATTIGCEIM